MRQQGGESTALTKRKEVTGGHGKLRKTGFRDFCFHPNIFRMMESRRTRWTGHGGRVGGKTQEGRVLIGNPGRKMLSGSRSRKWKDSTEIDVKEVMWEGID